MDAEKLRAAISSFLEHQSTHGPYYEENWSERIERREYYQSFTKDRLVAMTEEEFLEYVSKLWSMLIWGNKKYVVDKLIADNGFLALKNSWRNCCTGQAPLRSAGTCSSSPSRGWGPPPSASFSHTPTRKSMSSSIRRQSSALATWVLPACRNTTTSTRERNTGSLCHRKRNRPGIKEIRRGELRSPGCGLLSVGRGFAPCREGIHAAPVPEPKKPATASDSRSLHDEIKEKLVAIGELLGFDSRSEVKITTGAVVDAVWEAKIGNMGKAIYVFEVQSKGSIDSLILNLRKAQSNAAVQAVVAVADEEQLAKIIRESAGVIEEKSLRTWDSEDVLAVYDALVRAHESINKLALVPESF